jgi:mono/diheme cytochrome c family protein
VAAGVLGTPSGRDARRHRTPVGFFCIQSLLVLFLAACDSLPGKPTEADKPLRPAQVVDFDALYATNCAGCHGADGTLGAARPLNDPVYLAYIEPRLFERIVALGVPNSLMPGFAVTSGGTLTDAQIDILTRGIYSRWAQPAETDRLAIPAVAPAPGDTQRGAAAYASYCAGCHGDGGHGGARGGSIVDPSYLALVSDQALRAAVICGRPDLGMPDWRGERGRAMNEQQISDVVAWLIAQRGR